jgi:hypothetical protein
MDEEPEVMRKLHPYEIACVEAWALAVVRGWRMGKARSFICSAVRSLT